MTNYQKWAAVLLLGIVSSGWAMAEKPKMATVDMQKLFKEYHRTTTAQKHFNAEYAEIQRQADEKAEAIAKLRRSLQAVKDELNKKNLSEEQRVEKQNEGKMVAQEIVIAERGIQTFTASERAKVAQKKAASMQGIMSEIKQKVIALSEKMGYDFVFDRSGLSTNQVGFFLYLKDATDITGTMLKELNKFAPGADSQ